jgi:hypothetical protein
MTLEQYAYLAEILGTATVVVSLIYLAIQVKQGNAHGRAGARYAFVQATSDINMTIAQNRELSGLWRRGLEKPGELNEDETMQLWMLIGQYCNAWLVMQQLHLDGMLARNQWFVVKNDVSAIMCSAGGRAFWRVAGNAFDPHFRRFVDDILERGEQSYDMLAR